jgi:hypothetical protein
VASCDPFETSACALAVADGKSVISGKANQPSARAQHVQIRFEPIILFEFIRDRNSESNGAFTSFIVALSSDASSLHFVDLNSCISRISRRFPSAAIAFKFRQFHALRGPGSPASAAERATH